MAAANKDILINILTKAAGTSSVKELNSVLSSLNQNTVSIGKNNQFYQKGVAGSISGTKALTATASGLNKIIQQQAASMRAANAVRAAEVKAIELTVRAKKAEMAQDTLALRQLREEIQLRELAVRERKAALAEIALAERETARATRESAAASGTAAAGMKNVHLQAGGASFALLSLGQAFQDSAQFGMGFAQGLRAVNNNIQQFVTALTFASISAGGFRNLMKDLTASFWGPTGFILVFSVVSAAMEFFSLRAQKAKKAAKELSSQFAKLAEVVPTNNIRQFLVTQRDLEAEAARLRQRIEELALASARAAANYSTTTKNTRTLTSASAVSREEQKKLALQLEDVNEALEKINKSGPEYVKWLRSVAGLSAVADKKTQDYMATIADLEAEFKMSGEFEQFEQRIRDLQDAIASGIGFDIKDPEEGIRELNARYRDFLSSARAINSEVRVTRSEFAEMMGAGHLDRFFLELRVDRLIAITDEAKRLSTALAGIGLVFKSFDPSTGIAARLDEIRRSATLVGRLDGVEGLGSDELRMMSDATLSEMDRLGAEIEARNRAGTDSWRAHWISRTEASVKAASIVSSSVGDIGTVFMQLAQTGDRSNKRMFETGKKFAIAQALISTYVGFTKALEQKGPLGLVAGAAVLASGMAKVAAIRATTMNGSGGSGSSGASGVSSAPTFFTGFGNVSDFPGSSPSFPIVPLNQQTVNINLSASGRDLVGVIESEASASQRRIGGGAIGSSMFSASRSGGILSTGNRDNLVI
jgi:hypothetical protein